MSVPQITSATHQEYLKVTKYYNTACANVEGMCTESLYLLMKGKYYARLVNLLENEKTPFEIRLHICNYFLNEGNAKEFDAVEEMLAAFTKKAVNVLHYREKEEISKAPTEEEPKRRKRSLVDHLLLASLKGLKIMISMTIACTIASFLFFFSFLFIALIMGPR